jgi:hypothetical protein
MSNQGLIEHAGEVTSVTAIRGAPAAALRLGWGSSGRVGGAAAGGLFLPRGFSRGWEGALRTVEV